jgi:hypothetical protein
MAKLSKTNPAQTKFIVLLTIDLGRVRWIEPLPRSARSWWPIRARSEGDPVELEVRAQLPTQPPLLADTSGWISMTADTKIELRRGPGRQAHPFPLRKVIAT